MVNATLLRFDLEALADAIDSILGHQYVLIFNILPMRTLVNLTLETLLADVRISFKLLSFSR